MPGKFENSWQLYCLFLSCGCGFWLGLLYELFGIGRQLVAHRAAAVLWDILFGPVAVLILFLFALPVTGGVLRWYIWLGSGLGFAAFRVTLGRLFRRLYRWFFMQMNKLAEEIRRLLTPVTAWLRRIRNVVGVRGQKMRKNTKNFFKKLLHHPTSMVYNQDDNTMG
ncbi:MAG: spore cortex biosynthesis protein YabQ [Clostridia bacterium]|nr:spore cortex biosynthesis protein YabQ [Clostridia bacterium]